MTRGKVHTTTCKEQPGETSLAPIHRQAHLRRLSFAFTLAIFLVINLCRAAPCQAPAQPERDRAVKLANGLRVIVVEEPAFPMVSCQLWLHVGSMNDPSGASGTCHVVEHLLAETMKANGAMLARQLVGSGGRYDAFTSDDFTVFLENLPSSQLELALALQAERLKDKSFTQQQLDEAAKQVSLEIDAAQKTPERTLMREVRALRYTRHPYKNLPAGIDEEVKYITPEMVTEFFRQYFVPANATLVIAGDVKQAQALKMAEQYLGGIRTTRVDAPLLIPHEPIQTGERRVYLKYGGRKNKLLVAFQAPAATQKNAAAATVLESLLGGNSGGLLKENAIDLKVCDSVATAYELRKRPGMLTVSAEAPTSVNSSKLLSTIEEICDKVREGGFDEAALNEAKKRAVFSLLKNKAGPYKTAFQLGFFDSLDKLNQADLWQRQLESVSKQDVMHLAASYLVPAKRTVGFLLGQTSTTATPKTAWVGDDDSLPNGDAWHRSCRKLEHGTYGPVGKLERGSSSSTTNLDRRAYYLYHPTARLERSELGRLQIAAYDPYLEGSRTDKTDEPSDEEPDTMTDTTAPATTAPPASETKPATTPEVETTPPVKPVMPPVTTEPETATAETKPPVVAGLRSNMTEFILVNGIRLIIFKAESSPVVRISGAVRAGHVYDPPGKPGVSEVAVACFNGSSARISKENSAKLQSQIGLDRPDQIRFFDGREQISFHTTCLSQDLGTQLKLISHHLTDPQLDDTALSAARNTVAGAIKRRQNTIQDRANRLILQNLLSDKSQFNPPGPHELLASVLKITADDVNQFRTANVSPSTTTIVIAGNVDPQQAQRLVAGTFNAWQGKGKPPSVTAQPNKRQVTKVSLPNDEPVKVELALGRLLSTPASQPEYARLLLADCALIKHPLYARLTNLKRVTDLDESVSMQSTIMPMASQCAWILNVRLPEAKLAGITGAIKQQFDEIGSTGLTQQELDEMKRFIGGQVSVNRLSDVVHSGDSIVDAVSTDREPDYWFNLPSAIEATALADVNRFIKDEFRPDKACVVVAGSKKAIKLVPSFRRSKD